MTLDLARFEALTFDCYGTLIDWEAGILAALGPVLEAHAAEAGGDALLEAFARHEAELEAGEYQSYRAVLRGTLAGICAGLGFEPAAGELDRFAGSVADWPAFEDSPAALAALKSRFRLGIITNCDDDLFAASNRRLGVDFDWVVTAEQARSYKPSRNNFDVAFGRLGLPRDRILHVAQSLYHDHVPAKALGLATVWVDRRGGRSGPGATPPARASPDLRVPDMAALAALAAG